MDTTTPTPAEPLDSDPGASPAWVGESYTTSVTVSIPDPEPGRRHIVVCVRSEDAERLRELTGA